MSDFEQSPVPPVVERSEPGSESGRVVANEPEAGQPPASEPPSEQEPASESSSRKRGSIRPAPAGWRSSEGRLRPAPMVVVYSGDSDRPAPDWEREQHSPRSPSVRGTLAGETGPFLPVQKDFSRETLPSGLFDALSAESQEPPEVASEPRDVVPPETSGEQISAAEEPSRSEPPRADDASSVTQAEQRSVVVASAAVSVAREVERGDQAQFAEASESSRAERAAAITARALKSPSQAPPPDTASSVGADPTLRMPRVQPAVRRSSAPAAPSEASMNAAKALAARGMRVSGRPPPEETRVPGVPRSLVVGLWAIAVGLALFLIQRARVRSANEHAASPVALVEPERGPAPAVVPAPARAPDPQSATAPPAVSAGPAVPPAVSAAPASESLEEKPVEAPPAEAPSSAKTAELPSAPSSGVRTVKLDVMPADAKVFVKGAMRKGPPFLFEVPPGSRVVVEVVRPGYVARRVVLDGSKVEFAVGLLRRAPKPRARAENANTSASTDSGPERPAVVQSGL